MNDVIAKTICNALDAFFEAPFHLETFVEVLEIIKNYVQEGDITIYGKENTVVSRMATTLMDLDELRCLDHMIRKSFDSMDIIHSENCREGVSDMLLVPLHYGKCTGMLVYEKYHGQIDMITENENLLFQILSICMASYLQDREVRKNFYIDSLTGIPGQNYFLLYLDRLKENELSQWILVTRITDYSSQIQIVGTKKWNQMIIEISKILQIKGKTYRIGNDTFATICSGDKADVYEKIVNIKEDLRKQYDIKMLLLDVLLYDDLLAAIEREMPKCRQGNVYIPDNGDNSIFDIFKEQAEKKIKKPKTGEKILDSADFDLFDFL